MFSKPRLVCANVLVEREFEIRLLEVLIARFAIVGARSRVMLPSTGGWVLLPEPDFLGERQQLALALLLQPRCGARHFN